MVQTIRAAARGLRRDTSVDGCQGRWKLPYVPL
jgi:hypothetical protein